MVYLISVSRCFAWCRLLETVVEQKKEKEVLTDSCQRTDRQRDAGPVPP